jgi:branched-subunit amino acid ABC-type transport system permease component
MQDVLSAVLVGIATGVPIFLVASGLTLTYSIMGILNFAHGGFFMLGAFAAASFLGRSKSGLAMFLAALILGGLVAAAAGVVSERIVFRRAGSDHYAGLLASFALLLLITGLVEVYWGGGQVKTVSMPDAFSGSVSLAGAPVPRYNLVLVGVGVIMASLLALALARTWYGRRVRAVAADPLMASALGISAARTASLVFAVGSLLAGLAGAMMTPLLATTSTLANSYILLAFAAILIGGVGSTAGALGGSVVLGLVNSFATNYAPTTASYAAYVVMGVSLVIWPFGLTRGFMGHREAV